MLARATSVLALILMIAGLTSAPSAAQADDFVYSEEIPVSGRVHDVVIDQARSLAYISTDASEIQVLDTSTNVIVGVVETSHVPWGMDLSLDGSELYIALWGAMGFETLDLETGQLQGLTSVPLLGSSQTYEVFEASPGKLLVGASDAAQSSLVRHDLVGGTNTVVASGESIDVKPHVVGDRSTRAYVSHAYTGNDINIVDLTQDDWPIIAETRSMGGGTPSSLSPDGDTLATPGPRIIDVGMDTLESVSTPNVGTSIPAFSDDDNTVYYLNTISGTLYEYDIAGQGLVETDTGCGADVDVEGIARVPGAERFYAYGFLGLCYIALGFENAPDVGGGTFVDDDTSIFQDDIEALVAADVTKGCNKQGTSFCPTGHVTRGQMAAFLVRAFGLTDIDSSISFTDIGASVFEQDILKLATAGITSGCGNGEFCPGGLVTRAQMAAFLVRAFGLTDIDPSVSFTDTGASVFEQDILKLATAGITSGCGNGEFCPADPVTRGQMAAFLGRAFEYPKPSIAPRQETAVGNGVFAFDAALSAGCTFLDGEVCPVSVDIPVGSLWFVQEGWVQADWSTLTSAEQAEFASSSLYTEISLNGSVLPTWSDGVLVDSSDTAIKIEGFQFPVTMVGTHVIDVVYGIDTLATTIEVTVNIGEGTATRLDAPDKTALPLGW